MRSRPPSTTSSLDSNQHLERANAQMRVINDDIRFHIVEFRSTQKALRALNRQLESRVAERTSQMQAALRESEQQRATIVAVFKQIPTAMCLLRGSKFRFAYVNDSC